MDRLQAMRTFVKVAEHGGFAEAGRSLGMSPPAVTRAIAFLEDAIGASLLTRTTRSVKLTEAGERYLSDCHRILSDISDAEASAAGLHAQPTGTLSVTAPVLFGSLHMRPIITSYLDAYPRVNVRSIFVDRNVNLIEEGIDVALRIGALPDSELQAVAVGAVRRIVCASPAYLKKHGTPRQPSDLAHHQLVVASSTSQLLEWRFGKKTTVSVTPRITCNLNDVAITMAIESFGVTRVLSYQVTEAIERGRLKAILTDFEPEPIPVHLLHTGGRGPSAKVRSFIDFAVEKLRATPALHGGAKSRPARRP